VKKTKKPCFLALFTVQRTVVLARRCTRYRHAFRSTILALLSKAFCPLGLEPLGFSPVGQLRVAS